MVQRILFLAACLLGAACPVRAAAPGPDRVAAIGGRIGAGCEALERDLSRPNAEPSVRQLTAAALGWLELGEPPARAETLMRHAFGLQVMDSAAPGFGTVPWQENHPEIKDANAIEFTMLSVGVVFLRHGAELSPAFKVEAEPHLRAAIKAIERHEVPVRYSNIYLMKLANLLLLGQAVGDASACAAGKANFHDWLAFTRTNGVAEYDSPTYSPIQADCLALAFDLVQDSALKAELKSALDFYWADFAANYFPGRETMTAPASRDYNFLFSDCNIDYSYYLAGLRSHPPGDTLLCDSVRSWAVARMASNGYWPAPAILDLARLPERVVLSRFGTAPGQDRYVWITPDFTLGSANAYYGPQDKTICVELASAKNLPLISLVVDDLDAPFGKARAKDRSGHAKPHHLPCGLASAQFQGCLFALLDLRPAALTGKLTNLASNFLLPVRADELRINGLPVDASRPFHQDLTNGATIGLREGRAGVAIRFLLADAADGQTSAPFIEYDGNPEGAGRLAVYHYRGPARQLPEIGLRLALLVTVARCEDQAAFAGLLDRAAGMKFTSLPQAGSHWEACLTTETSRFEAALDLSTHRPLLPRLGRKGQPEILTVNGRDLADEFLGRGRSSVNPFGRIRLKESPEAPFSQTHRP